MGASESKEFKPTPSGRSSSSTRSNPLQSLIRSFKKSPRPRKKSKDSQKSKKSTDSDSSSQKQKKELKRQNSNVSKSDIALDVNENSVEDSPPETERKEAEVPVKKGSLELDNVPHIDACATLSPRTHDDIPVSTVFAEEKSRQSVSDDEIKRTKSQTSKSSSKSNTSSNAAETKRKISRESSKSTSSNPVKPATEADLAMAAKLKKELEDTISELLAAASKAELYLSDETEKEKMSKDDSDTIHLIVGQTRLLCQDKLGKQFRNLCLKTLGDEEIKVSETRPTADDLIGFWELVNIQVDLIKTKLSDLHLKKDNDWKEPEKEVKTPPKPKKKTTPKTNSSKASTASSEKAKQRDAERKARLAAMRAKTKAAKKAEEEAAQQSETVVPDE